MKLLQRSFLPLAATLPFMASALAETIEAPQQLQPVVISGTASGGYSAPTAPTGTKTDTPIMETPFSVAVVPSAVLRDQQAIRLQDATRNISGVQTNFGYGGLYEAFALRGFETNTTLRNGLRVAGGVGRSSVEMSNVDSVEVLKGPAAMIFGRIEPGGLINVVTRRPQAMPSYSIEQQFGSFDLTRTTVDATGPVGAEENLLYRVVASYFESDQFIDNAPHGRTKFLAPSLAWRGSDLEVNFDFEYRDMNPLIANGIPAIGNRPASIPVTTYLGGDIGDRANVRRSLAELGVSYRINTEWKLRTGISYARDGIDFEQFFGGAFDESTGDFAIDPWFDQRRSHGTNAYVDLAGTLETHDIEHRILAGADAYQLNYEDTGFINGWMPVDTSNIFSPTYYRSTAYGAHAALLATAPDWTSVGHQDWQGLYAQDEIKVGAPWHVLIGGRFDRARARAGSITLEYAPPGSTLADVQKTTAEESKFSPRIGLLYQPLPTVSLFGNYVESLGTWGTSLGVAADVDGRPLPAQRSSSYEAGLKIEALGGRLRSTLAAFSITKTNLATRDLSSIDPLALRATGEARSQGIEFDISGELSRSLSLIASYAYTDARFIQDDSGLQDHRLANVPLNSGSAWIRYQAAEPLALGVGANLRGQRQGDNENTFQMPGYATVDLFASYRGRLGAHKFTAQVNLENVTNRRYFINSNVYDAYPRYGVMPGQSRTLIGSVQYEI